MTGKTKPPRFALSDANGRIRFSDLQTGRHVLRVAKPSTTTYRGTPIAVEVGGGDARGVDLRVALK